MFNLKNVKLILFIFLIPTFCFAQKYVPGEVIIKLKGSNNTFANNAFIGKVHVNKKLSLKRSFKKINVHHFKINSKKNVKEIIEELKYDPAVEYAEPNYFLKKSNVEDDNILPVYNKSQISSAISSTDNTYQTETIDIQKIQAISSNSIDKPIIAIIDTGIDYNHYVFENSNSLWTNENEIPNNGIDDDNNGYIDDTIGWNFYSNHNDPIDEDGHGTHVAGIVLSTNINIFAETISEEASIQIMPLKFLGPGGVGTTSDAIKAIYYAVENGAQILNNSWGGENYSAALHEAVTFSYENRVSFVAAAGNAANNNDYTPIYPASFDVPNIISIAATNDWDSLASFSNYGLVSVDLGSPGVAILSTFPGDTFGYSTGTSMSTPYASGTAALILKEKPELTGFEIKQIIFNSSTQINELSAKLYTGSRIDIIEAINYAKNTSFDGEQPEYIPSINQGNRELASEIVSSGAGCGLIRNYNNHNNYNNTSSKKFSNFMIFFALIIAIYFILSFYKNQSPSCRRKYKRFNINSQVALKIDGKELIGSINSISLGGAGINTDALVNEGGIVTMKIASPDGSEQIEVKGKVVWKENSKHEYGIEFINAKGSVLQSIARWTKNLA